MCISFAIIAVKSIFYNIHNLGVNMEAKITTIIGDSEIVTRGEFKKGLIDSNKVNITYGPLAPGQGEYVIVCINGKHRIFDLEGNEC